jgi:hypothetical protein
MWHSGHTAVSNPERHEYLNRQREMATARLPLFPNAEEWSAKLKEVAYTCAAAADVAVVPVDKVRQTDTSWFYIYMKTRGKPTMKGLKMARAVLNSNMKQPLGWYGKIPEVKDTWIADDMGMLRPWPVVPGKLVPTAIYSSGVSNPQLAEWMEEKAGGELALALVERERSTLTVQIRQADQSIYDIVKRVKTAALGTDVALWTHW